MSKFFISNSRHHRDKRSEEMKRDDEKSKDGSRIDDRRVEYRREVKRVLSERQPT